MQKTWVQSLGRDDPLEEETAIHSRALVMKNPMDWGAWWALVLRVAKSWTQLSTHIAAPNSLRFPRSRQKPVTKRGVQNGKEREGNTHNTAHWRPSFIFNCYQREVLGVTHTTLPNSPLPFTRTNKTTAVMHDKDSAGTTGKERLPPNTERPFKGNHIPPVKNASNI